MSSIHAFIDIHPWHNQLVFLSVRASYILLFIILVVGLQHVTCNTCTTRSMFVVSALEFIFSFYRMVVSVWLCRLSALCSGPMSI